ncbi:MAG TPA: NADH-quinone oxidoreductase subunit H, partial [Casimicrobiaceae bacterium]
MVEQHVLNAFASIWGPYWDPVWSFVRPVWPGIWTLAKIVAIAIPLIISVAYLTLAERK